jgi:hypothetical protein
MSVHCCNLSICYLLLGEVISNSRIKTICCTSRTWFFLPVELKNFYVWSVVVSQLQTASNRISANAKSLAENYPCEWAPPGGSDLASAFCVKHGGSHCLDQESNGRKPLLRPGWVICYTTTFHLCRWRCAVCEAHATELESVQCILAACIRAVCQLRTINPSATLIRWTRWWTGHSSVELSLKNFPMWYLGLQLALRPLTKAERQPMLDSVAAFMPALQPDRWA